MKYRLPVRDVKILMFTRYCPMSDNIHCSWTQGSFSFIKYTVHLQRERERIINCTIMLIQSSSALPLFSSLEDEQNTCSTSSVSALTSRVSDSK